MWLAWLACTRDTPAPTSPKEEQPAPVPEPTGTTEAWMERFQAELLADGLLLAEGKASELDPSECCSWESCYLFNPDNEYHSWWVPPSPSQTVPDPIVEDGLSLAWRLRPDEAIVAVGRTPPQASYFSYRTYLHDRYDPVTGLREQLFFNLGDSLNNFVMGTGEGGPFDADFVLVTTADAATDALIRAAAARAGLPDSMISTEAVAGTPMTLGVGEEADTFRMQHRIALFDDLTLGEAYMQAPPVTVWRVSPATEQPHVPIATPPLRPRGAGTNEDAWAEAYDALEQAILAAHADYTAHPLPTIASPTGEDCPPGCNRDTFFGVSLHFILPTWGDGFLVAYGVNHERTGKSVYSNFAVVSAEQHSAVEGANSREMPGSARVYLPDHPLADDLYAYRIARTCDLADEYCVEVPLVCPGFSSLAEGGMAFRAYTEPSTGTGPDTAELLVDKTILFSRPSQ
jgi:hypothetical protein